MLFMPPLLVAAGRGCSRLGCRPAALAATAALLGLQTLALQSMIQVVYPV
jgi:methylthioxylose transferase